MAVRKLIEAPLEQDLKVLSIYWHQKRFRHRISEESGLQIIWIEDESYATQMQNEYDAFCSGDLQFIYRQSEKPQARLNLLVIFKKLWTEYPVTMGLLLFSVLGFLAVTFDIQALVDKLVYQTTDASQFNNGVRVIQHHSINFYMEKGEYWRLFTPIFLHFGWVHIIFNSLWLWELGHRIEKNGGAIHLLSIALFIAVASNMYQSVSTPFSTFGGMSGVIYGLLGYCFVFSLIYPQKRLEIPIQVYVIMLISLLIGFSGVFDAIAPMANTAHLSGLIFGIIIGIPSALLMLFFNSD